MIDTLMLVDDEDLFHLVFEDACSLLDIALSLQAIHSSDEANKRFKEWFPDDPDDEKPECVFVDLNIVGSSFDGIEKARSAGAQFWMIKSDDIEPRLEEFRKDYEGYQKRTAPFKVYR